MNIIRTICDISQQNLKNYLKKNVGGANKLFRKKKESRYMNELLRNTEQDYIQGRVRTFYVVIKKHQKFNSTLKAIKNKNNRILLDPQTKATRWQEYFEELLNGEMPVTPIPA